MKMAKLQPLARLIATLTLTLLLAAAEPKAARADMIYVSDSGNDFGTLNLTAGANFGKFTLTSVFSLPFSGTMTALGLNGTNSLTAADNNGEAYTVNAITGATVDKGTTNTAPLGGGGVGGVLYTIDNATFKLTAFTFPGLGSKTIGTYANPDGLVVNGQDGNIYIAVQNNASDQLYKISIATGNATLVGSIGFTGLFAGVYDYNNGTIYGFDSNNEIITLNTSTGVGTKVGNYVLPGGNAIYAAAIPEPSAMALMGVGLICAAGMAVRRRFATVSA